MSGLGECAEGVCGHVGSVGFESVSVSECVLSVWMYVGLCGMCGW